MLERSTGLSPASLEAIAGLEARCLAADGGRLKLEWGVLRRRDPEAVNDLLAWSDGELVGFCGRYAFGGTTPEATGMVDPHHRRRGVGTELLDGLLALCAERGDRRVLLVTPRTSVGARSLALRAGARFEHAEHALVLHELRGASAEDPAIALRRATAHDEAEVTRLLQAGFGHTSGAGVVATADEATLLAERDGRAIATMRVTEDATGQGIYGFVVDPALQGRGIGRDLLRRVCAEALREGATQVHLEVAVDNDRALGLYTSVGFALDETEDYYELAVPAA